MGESTSSPPSSIPSLARQAPAGAAPVVTIVTPAMNEEENLPALHARIVSALEGIAWEWIVVDDQSTDRTYEVMTSIARDDPRVRCIRFARNFGSHTAIACGLHHAKGRTATVMAADLQDPPETIPVLLDEWRKGFHVVWAQRGRREGEKASTVGFARVYYFIMRTIVGIKQMPATGADFFLIDRRVMEAFRGFREANVSIFALLTWMGFRQTIVTYTKQARKSGQSKWTFEKKLKLLVDSVTSFTYLPIRLMSYFGFVSACLGLLYASVVVINALRGVQLPYGWSSTICVILVIGGIQMLMMGVLGEYLWRALDESRARPRYIVESTSDWEIEDARARSESVTDRT